MTANVPLCLLYSYAYLGMCRGLNETLCQAQKAGKVDLMLDSGAFSAFNAQMEFKHVNLDDYCSWLQKYAGYFRKYVMLDVVKNEKQSRKNYEIMVKRGLKPMYVLTVNDMDFGYLKEAVSITPDICVAGGYNWSPRVGQRFQKASQATDGKARIHGLAFVKFPQMLQLPLASVDSSTWLFGSGRYGVFHIFMGDQGMKYLHGLPSLVKALKARDQSAKDAVDRLGVSYKALVDDKNWHGKQSIPKFAGAVAYADMQRYCFKRGLRLYLASTTRMSELRSMIYIHDNLGDLSWEKWKSVR